MTPDLRLGSVTSPPFWFQKCAGPILGSSLDWFYADILRLLILDYFYDNEDRTDEEAEPTFSEDEALTQRGVRRSQSVKLTRSRVRKDVRLLFQNHTFGVFLCCIRTHFFCLQTRYGSLKIKGKKRPALSSVNYGMWPVTVTQTLSTFSLPLHALPLSLTLTFSNTHRHTLMEKCVGWDGLLVSFTAVNVHPAEHSLTSHCCFIFVTLI